MKKNSPTAAGPSEPQQANTARIDAINQIFALFKRNYHNQFFKAYGNETDVNATKRLWLDALQRFEVPTLLRAARMIIEGQEFLPTLAAMIKACDACSSEGLPDAHSAYLEACRAPSPKAAFGWSHPAVYYAGRACDWYFLQNNTEQVAFPVYRQRYQEICDRVRAGEQLSPPAVPQLPASTDTPVDKAKARSTLAKLRADLDL